MTWLVAAIRRYPIVAITVVVGIIGLVLAFTGNVVVAQWLISGYALIVAAMQAWSMVRQLLTGQFGLDVLAVMAIVSTVVVGEFWASLIIVLMISGGEALEDYAAGRAERDLRSLLDRAPVQAHRYTATGDIEDVPVDDVGIGDRLLLRPSEIVPVDAVLESAETSLDESSLTGESLPVDKVRGDQLWSGSVNGPGAVDIRATALASDSQYQLIVKLVAEASASKAPMVRLADRYSIPFTAIALLIGGIAWAVSGDPVRFAEVLVVATPCPLLLAAPIAFMSGMSRSSKAGVVVKGASALEQLAAARTIAFDKTGTLTRGVPEVVALHPEPDFGPDFGPDELLGVVASAEQYSSHVLAAALRQAATDRGIPLREASRAGEVATHGVEATIEGKEVVVGKPAFVAERATGVHRRPFASGEAAVYVAVDGRFAGTVVLRDELREEAPETVERLRRSGIRHIILITGDVEQTARPIAEQLGIDDVHAECLPQDKVDLVRTASPRPVIMVGDGVNDAPVLAVADVGIALGARGSTAASESADVVILVDDVSKVADAVEIGQRTVHIALQSIWLGIAISVGLMLVAAFGWLPAIIGAALQEVVDLITILNALRALLPGRTDAARLRVTRRSPSGARGWAGGSRAGRRIGGSGRGDLNLSGGGAGLHGDLARLRLLAHRDRDAQHAVVVGRADVLGVDAVAEVQLAQERAARALVGEPLDALAAGGALGADGEQLTVEVDVDGARVDSGEVRVQDVQVAILVQVDGHEPGPLPSVQKVRGDAIQFAERVEKHGHGKSLLQYYLSRIDSTIGNLALAP